MNNTISGKYDITDRELSIVKKIFKLNNVEVKSIEKHKQANDGDVLVTLMDNTKILIEVKEEDYETRFSKYGDIGIDLISSFQFKNGVDAQDWKGIKRGSKVLEFFDKIDKSSSSFKPGKITYSKSDLWLFFSSKPDGTLAYYSFFPGEFMKSKEFKKYLIAKCKFAVNNKPSDQMSYYDQNKSAVFYINHQNPYLLKNEFDIKNLKRKDPNGYTGGSFTME